MALNGVNEIDKLLLNERARCYFLWHLYTVENFQLSNYVSFQNSDFSNWALQAADAFLSSRGKLPSDHNQKNSACLQYIKQVEQRSKSDLISLEQLAWMKEDRACYFIWLNLKQFTYPSANSMLLQPVNCYQYHQLALYPTNTDERFKTIIQFLDLLLISKEQKLDQIAQLKENWLNIFEQKEHFTWLDKDNETQCKWAWNYCKKADLQNTFNLTPVSGLECYHAFRAFHDIWKVNEDRKEIFRIKLNKAWSQKKHRYEQVTSKDKISTSVYLDSKTKEQLDTLTMEQNRTMAEIIDYLIRKEYNSTRRT